MLTATLVGAPTPTATTPTAPTPLSPQLMAALDFALGGRANTLTAIASADSFVKKSAADGVKPYVIASLVASALALGVGVAALLRGRRK